MKQRSATAVAVLIAAGCLAAGQLQPQWDGNIPSPGSSGINIHGSGITFEWARTAGYPAKDAQTIADNDSSTDVRYFLNDEYHFNKNSSSVASIGSNNDTRIILWNRYLISAINKYTAATTACNNEISRVNQAYPANKRPPLIAAAYAKRAQARSLALGDLGVALHVLQDVYAHGNIQNLIQHDSFRAPDNWLCIATDNPNYDINWTTKVVAKVAGGYLNGQRYRATRNATLDTLTRFKNAVRYNANDI